MENGWRVVFICESADIVSNDLDDPGATVFTSSVNSQFIISAKLEREQAQIAIDTEMCIRDRYSGITGLKTGTTSGAGVCISASATRDGLKLIAVILGAPIMLIV